MGAEQGDVASIAVPAGVGDRGAAINDAVFATTAPWVEFDGVKVRRADFVSLGGLQEGVREGAVFEFCQRLKALGRDLELPPRPGGAAAVWLRRRRPGAPRDVEWLRGLFADNRIAARRDRPTRAPGERAIVVFTDAYPARSETFIYNEVAALRALGWSVRVEAAARPARVESGVRRATRIDYLEDDPPLRTTIDLIALALRHPLRVLRDLRDRRLWTADGEVWPLRAFASAARRLRAGAERHIHVHFAGGAALIALRLARVLGLTYSVVGHGYDIFASPRNLAAKLSAADFVVAPCEYTAAQLRASLPADRRDRVHVVVMGVDGAQFRRTQPRPDGRTVVAVGRLVEKKGFRHLLEAAAVLEREDPVDHVIIAGDGPLRPALAAAVESAGLGPRVELVEAWGPERVRELLERADVFAMPAVIASDGDRDAMPVVLKEALAMEVPVVASDVAGLPELVAPGWGMLVPPGDPHALARAIAALLGLPAAERAEMGVRGRAHVLAHCDVVAETRKLAALLETELRRAPARRR